MPAGYQAQNVGGFIQIDETYRNFALRQKGLIAALPSTNVGNVYAGTLWDYVVTVTADFPVVAIAPGSSLYACHLQYATRSGSNWTFHFYTLGGGPGPAYYYVFDVPQPVPGAYGLEVFTAGVALAFSAAHKYMRVVSGAAPAGKTYAVIEAAPYAEWYYDQDFSDPDRYYILRYNRLFYLSGSTITSLVECTYVAGPVNSDTGFATSPGSSLLVDVTNY